MKYVDMGRAKRIQVSDSCIAYEYPDGDKDIWGSIIEINGRYPDKGRTVNLKCKELVYIVSGTGKAVIGGKTIDIQQGDQLVINPGEKFYWEGFLTMFMPCTPAWYSQQHKIVD